MSAPLFFAAEPVRAQCFVCGVSLDANSAYKYTAVGLGAIFFACVDPCHSPGEVAEAFDQLPSQRADAFNAIARGLDIPPQLYDPDYLPLDVVDPYDPDAEREAIMHARAEAQTAALRPGVERAARIHTLEGSFVPGGVVDMLAQFLPSVPAPRGPLVYPDEPTS